MATVETRRAEELAQAALPQLRECAQEHGAGIAGIAVTRGLNAAERRMRAYARLTVMLNDDAPGWRAKDDARTGRHRRTELKRALRLVLGQCTGETWSVHLNANYSEVVVIDFC